MSSASPDVSELALQSVPVFSVCVTPLPSLTPGLAREVVVALGPVWHHTRAVEGSSAMGRIDLVCF